MSRRRNVLPRVLLVPAGIAVALFSLPIVALIARAPWAELGSILTTGDTRRAVGLSLITSLVTTGIALVLGVPLALMLARTRLPGRRIILAVCTLSMVLPPVVAGVALLSVLGRRAPIGRLLDDWFGVSIPFTGAAVVIAQLFVAMPFLVITLESALGAADRGPEETARALGARPWRVLATVTLPSVRSALVAGTVLTWARAIGEFGATITFAGNLPGVTRTLPTETYLTLQNDPDRALMLAVIQVAVCLGVLVALRRRWTPAITGRRP
jgi:molybdate transport system permease protein